MIGRVIGGDRVTRRLRASTAGRALAGFVGFVLGIGLVVILTDLTAVDRAYVENAAKRADDYRRAADDEFSQRCIWLLPLQAEECRYNANNAAAEQAHEEHDLAAQRQTAWWTKWMGLAAIVGVIASLVGVGLVWFTFRETRAATRVARREYGRGRLEAHKAEGTAQEQLGIAQDTAYRELRAYIGLSAHIASVNPGLVKGRLSIRNAGQTPAKIKLYKGTCIGPFPLATLPPGALEPHLFEQLNRYVNARGAERIDWFHPFYESGTPEEVTQWLEEPAGRALYFYGRIEFLDFLGKKTRILHFRYRNHGPPKKGEPLEMIQLPWGNEYEERDLEA
jgi:hypothetical protein